MTNYISNVFGNINKDKYKYITEITCPSCKKDLLHVISIIENSATIECPRCGYLQHLPSNHLINLKEIKQ